MHTFFHHQSHKTWIKFFMTLIRCAAVLLNQFNFLYFFSFTFVIIKRFFTTTE